MTVPAACCRWFAARRAAAAARAAGPGGMRCLRRCGGRVGERGHRGALEGGDVAVVADGGAGAVGGEAVAGDHDPGAGGDVEVVAPSRSGHA